MATAKGEKNTGEDKKVIVHTTSVKKQTEGVSDEKIVFQVIIMIIASYILFTLFGVLGIYLLIPLFFLILQKSNTKRDFASLDQATIGKIFFGSIILSASLFYSIFQGILPGISMLVVEILFLGLSFIFISKDKKSASLGQIFLAGLGILISAWFAIFTQSFFTLIFSCLLVYINISFVLSFKIGDMGGFGEYKRFLKACKALFLPLKSLPESIEVLKKSCKKDKQSSHLKIMGPILLLIVLLSLVIIPLLISADSVFREFFQNIVETISHYVSSSVLDIFPILFISFLVFSFFLFYKKVEIQKTNKKDIQFSLNLDNYYTYIVLGGINLVYILFVFVQVKYMFFGTHGMFQDMGLRYADYVHQGFYQLILISLVNFALLMLFSGGASTFQKKNTFVKGIYLMLSFLTICIIYSAFSRINLYIEAYHLTVLRFFVVYIVAMLFLAFILLSIAPFYYHQKTYVYFLIFTILSFTGIGYTNLDANIAKYNIESVEKIEDIDSSYILYKLSRDAIQQKQELISIIKDLAYYPQGEKITNTPWYNYNYYKTQYISQKEKPTLEAEEAIEILTK